MIGIVYNRWYICSLGNSYKYIKVTSIHLKIELLFEITFSSKVHDITKRLDDTLPYKSIQRLVSRWHAITHEPFFYYYTITDIEGLYNVFDLNMLWHLKDCNHKHIYMYTIKI